jgi:hypothetical protein
MRFHTKLFFNLVQKARFPGKVKKEENYHSVTLTFDFFGAGGSNDGRDMTFVPG